MGILEKISEIEKEIARTQKNKGEGRPGGASAAGGGAAGAGGAGRDPKGADRGPTRGPSREPQHTEQASDPERRGRGSKPGLLAVGPGGLALCSFVGGSPGGDPPPSHRYSLASCPEPLGGVEAVRT